MSIIAALHSAPDTLTPLPAHLTEFTLPHYTLLHLTTTFYISRKRQG
jgi:hypothetical protein